MDKKMSYHATDFLADLFDPTPSTAGMAPEPDRQPEPVAAPAVDPANLGPSGFDPADWIRQPDATGRWGWQRVDFDANDWPDFEGLPEVPACSECGGLEAWEPIAGDLFGATPGRWRCLKCDPPTKARRLAEKVARLRKGGPKTPQNERKGRPTTRNTYGAAVR